MISALMAATATTAFGAFSEAVIVTLAGYSITKSVGKTSFSFKK